MLPSNKCNEKNCPGWLPAIIAGAVMILFVALSAINEAKANEVVVTFNRELPFKSYEFTRTFEDKESFEMWLAMRLEDKGCDPYLTDMNIQFKPRKEDI
jgi:hypothetical protein